MGTRDIWADSLQIAKRGAGDWLRSSSVTSENTSEFIQPGHMANILMQADMCSQLWARGQPGITITAMPTKSKKQITGAKNVARRFQVDTDDDNNFTEDFYCVSFDDESNGSAPDPLRNALSSLHYFEAAGAHLSRTYCGDSERTQERKYRKRPPLGTKPIKSFFTAQTSGKFSLIYTYNFIYDASTLTATRFSCEQGGDT
ncbi:hypothetical protein V1525DRAFT_238658 [Lipomyces kononenkoae]|uniref:Uncharacterized protein n=1 Tax=Lipomyces kononenkoae TaxID=34357 RepID=A0ACC3SWB6_LIPKO